MFSFFISLFYIILKYEENNEILIYWIHGIKKIEFINNILKFSIIVLLIQLFLSLFIVPKTLDTARSYLRTSNIDYFPSILKPQNWGKQDYSNPSICLDRFFNDMHEVVLDFVAAQIPFIDPIKLYLSLTICSKSF